MPEIPTFVIEADNIITCVQEFCPAWFDKRDTAHVLIRRVLMEAYRTGVAAGRIEVTDVADA